MATKKKTTTKKATTKVAKHKKERKPAKPARVITDSDLRHVSGEGPASAVPTLEQMAARSKKPDALAACRTFAEEIMPAFPEVPAHTQVQEAARQ